MIEEIKSAAKNGIYRTNTCDTNFYGWDKKKHDQLLKLKYNPPPDMIITNLVKFGVTEWTIILNNNL